MSKKVTKSQALAALEDMDDYARMTIGVYPIGARNLLHRMIQETFPEKPSFWRRVLAAMCNRRAY